MPGWPTGRCSPPRTAGQEKPGRSCDVVHGRPEVILCVGRTGQQPHYWVASLDGLQGGEGGALFWEPLTGQQWAVGLRWEGGQAFASEAAPGEEPHPFAALYSLFRPDCLAVNLQPRPLLGSGPDRLCFDLSDARFWVRFPNPSHPLLRHPGSGLLPPEDPSPNPLYPNPHPNLHLFPCLPAELAIERALQTSIADMRAEVGLSCSFDDHLATILQVRGPPALLHLPFLPSSPPSPLLQPLLLAYELHRAVGCSFGQGDFQLAVRRTVEKGHVFRAYPCCFSHCHLPALLQSLRRTAAFREIALCGEARQQRGQDGARGGTRLAVRVRLVGYPQQLCALWVVVAATVPRAQGMG
mmetsp:Transcript_19471/g.27839  ORF Transcript_19471/g.27839 Transcript_19471/m.27839 type:complete len:354 (+) Transcript_19471:456-1517(+)